MSEREPARQEQEVNKLEEARNRFNKSLYTEEFNISEITSNLTQLQFALADQGDPRKIYSELSTYAGLAQTWAEHVQKDEVGAAVFSQMRNNYISAHERFNSITQPEAPGTQEDQGRIVFPGNLPTTDAKGSQPKQAGEVAADPNEGDNPQRAQPKRGRPRKNPS